MARCGWCWNDASTTTGSTPCIFCGRIVPWEKHGARHVVDINDVEAEDAGGGGSGLTVDNQSDPPASVTSLIVPGATIAGAEADLSDVVVVRRHSVTLTHTNITHLRATPFEIVPDPGIGKLVDFLRIFLVSSIVAPYTGIDAGADLLINLVDFPIGFASNNSAYDSGLLSDLFGSSAIVAVSPALDPDATATGTTQPIVSMFAGDLGALLLGLDQGAELQDGHADNTLTVTTVYTVIDLL